MACGGVDCSAASPQGDPLTRKSLAEFVQEQTPKRSGYGAWLPSIPEFDEAVAAFKAGTSALVIEQWLKKPEAEGGCGYGPEATEQKVRQWLRTHIELPSA